MDVYVLSKSTRKNKKWMVKFPNSKTVVHFGGVKEDGSLYSDYTKHKDKNRKARYLARHFKNENWNKSGIKSAGFWSRWLLWNQETLKKSIKDTEKRFSINIIKRVNGK